MLRLLGILHLFVNGYYVAGDELPSPYTCVIGAGYSGLAAAWHLKQMRVNFRVFEATEAIGGKWNFDPHVGVHDDGVPVFSSQYKHLRVNSPRQTMEYSVYPFPDDTPIYPTGTCIFKYLMSFAKHFNLLQNIQVHSYVTLVKWVNSRWEVTYLKTDDNAGPTNYTVSCDFVIVATGRYIKPTMPQFSGLNIFKGNYIHSHDYRDPEAYNGRRVLLVGAGPSGVDIGIQLQYTAAKVIHSYHRNISSLSFNNNYIKKPDINKFVPNGAIFTDGTFEEVDDVIFCTGFRFSHPFLDKSVEVLATDKFILPLYQNIVNIHQPSMMFVGLEYTVAIRTAEAQAEYAASLIAGKFKLPSPEQMMMMWLQFVYNVLNENKNIADIHNMIPYSDQYHAVLSAEAGVTRIPPVLLQLGFNFNQIDPLNFRNYEYEILDSHNFKRWYSSGIQALECPINI